MRHGKKINHLGRTASHRAALLSNMASSLILHKRIQTTLPKAKALRKYVEPLITKSKKDETHSRRVVFSYLQNKDAVRELFTDVAAQVAERPGGYTRILKLGTRKGDGAEMALIELVDYNEYLREETRQRKSRRTRRSRGGAGGDAPAAASPAPKAAAPAAPVAAAAAAVVEETLTVEPELAAVADAAAEAPAQLEAAADTATEAVEAVAEETAASLPELQIIDADAEAQAAEEERKDEDQPQA